jgi:hypothetical protein
MNGQASSAHLGVRERWLTTGFLGMSLVAFAINASTTNLILSKMMTNLRVELYHIHWVLTALALPGPSPFPPLAG